MAKPIQVDVVVDVSSARKGFKEVELFARDTKKKLDKDTLIKLELDVVQFQARLEDARRRLAAAKKDNDKNAIVSLQLETNRLQSGLTESKRQLANYVNTGNKDLSRLQAKFNGLGDVADAALGGFGRTLIGGTVATAVAGLANGVITLAGNLQQAQIAFKTMLGSATEAEVLLKDLSDFAKRTPFELVGLRDQAKLLLAYGFEANEVIDTLTTLGNISAGVGTDKLPRLVYALGQVRAAGRLTGQDLRQFTETGVPLLEELSKVTGISTQEMVGNIGNLKISYEQVLEALNNLTGEGGKFNGLLAAQSQTLQGSISNLKDSLNILGEQVGTIFVPVLTKVVQGISALIGALGSLGSISPEIAGSLGAISLVLIGLTGPIGIVTSVVLGLSTAFAFFGEDIGKAAQSVQDFIDKLRGVPTDSEIAMEIKGITSQSTELTGAVDNARVALERFQAEKINQSGTRSEFEKTKQQAIATTQALIKQLEALVALSNGPSTSITGRGVGQGLGGLDLSLGGFNSRQLQKQQAELKRLNNETFEDAQKLRKELEKTPIIGGGGGGGKAKDEVKTLSEQLKDLQSDLLDTVVGSKEYYDTLAQIDVITKKIGETGERTYGDIVEEQKALAEQAKKTAKAQEDLFKGKAKAVIDGFSDSIQDSIDKVEDLSKKIQDVDGDLKDIGQSIAERIIDIEQEIADKQNELATGDGDQNTINKLNDEIAKLQEELNLGVSEVDPAALEKARQEENKSQIQKLLDKQLALENEKKILIEQKDFEVGLQETLNAKKIELEQAFTAAFQIEQELQTSILKAEIEKRIQEYRRLQAAAEAAGGGGGSSNVTNNINQNITNEADAQLVLNGIINQSQDVT